MFAKFYFSFQLRTLHWLLEYVYPTKTISDRNKENRSKQKTGKITGSKSFAAVSYDAVSRKINDKNVIDYVLHLSLIF